MVQEVTTTSWGKRILNSFAGILFGVILILASIFLIFWNEGNGIHTTQSLEQAKSILISIPNTPIDPKNNMRVVYLTGLATTNNILIDKMFNTKEQAIKLNRHVEMYQWQENTETKTEKEIGGSERETKTYTYSTVWSPKLIDSSHFKELQAHQNPNAMSIKSHVQYAKNVTVGDFTLPLSLIKSIKGKTPVELNKVDTVALSAKFNKPVKVDGDKLYIGDDAQTPKIGDIRITMSAVLPQAVSIIAQQNAESLQPYMAASGKAILLIEMGQISPQEMIHNAMVENNITMWILRLVSLIMLIIGFGLILRPAAVLADVLPFLGSLMGIGTGILAFVLGLCVWVVCVALAWFVVRPILSLVMILIALVIFGAFYMRRRKR